MPGDEAVLRIVMQDAAGGAAGAASSAGPATPPSATDAAGTANAIRSEVALEKYAQGILAGAQEDLARFQKGQAEAVQAGLDAQKAMVKAGMDAQIEMQDIAREILQYAEEDLAKFQAEQQEIQKKQASGEGGVGGIFKSLTGAVKSGLEGDVGGAMKGLTGKGGPLEMMGVSAETVAAAAPPVAIALAAKEIGDRVNRAVIDGLKTGIGAAGSVAAGIASTGDVTGQMGQAGDQVTKFGEKVASVAPEVGYLAVAAGETTKALSGLMQVLDQTAKHYGEFSVEIGVAEAQAEARRTLRDFQRAQSLGGLGGFVEAKSKLENDVEDIKTRLLERMLPAIIRVVTILDYVAVGIGKQVDAVLIIVDMVKDPKWLLSAEKREAMLERIRDLLEDEKTSRLSEHDPTAALFQVLSEKGGVVEPDLPEADWGLR